MELPRLYPILDASALRSGAISVDDFARALSAAGLNFLQLRDKDGMDDDVLGAARLLRAIFPAGRATLILNDRVHLLDASGFDGVHVGQEDAAPGAVRERIGPSRLLGYSTHNAGQLTLADAAPVDYVAIGPVFATQSKAKADPVVGLAGVAEARRLTDKPLVAIGGITLENARPVIDAGADSIALISALVPSDGSSAGKVVGDFLARIG